MPGTPKSQAYVSAPLSPSGSVAVVVNWTASGAEPEVGWATMLASGAAVVAAPLPRTSNQLTLNRFCVLPRLRNTRNSSCVPLGGLVRSRLTSLKTCQSPVGVMLAVVPTSVPVGESRRTSIVPPAPAEATRKRIPVTSLRLTGL